MKIGIVKDATTGNPLPHREAQLVRAIVNSYMLNNLWLIRSSNKDKGLEEVQRLAIEDAKKFIRENFDDLDIDIQP